jgi:hypothetical protein
MAEVMEELDAARDQLLDDADGLVGLVKDVKEVEKRLRHKLLPRNAWRLIPFFELFMCTPKDELHQWYVLVCTSMYWYVLVCTYLILIIVGRYLGLFGDHIVPAVLHRYTQVLRRADLVNSRGKPLVTTARIEAVWKRLAGRMETVVADTSMVTLSTEYAAHFHDIYINGKENAKMTGDRMKMLMLTLPFLVRDLIAPEVFVCTRTYHDEMATQSVCTVFTRLSSSTELLIMPGPGLACAVYRMFLTPVTRW